MNFSPRSSVHSCERFGFAFLRRLVRKAVSGGRVEKKTESGFSKQCRSPVKCFFIKMGWGGGGERNATAKKLRGRGSLVRLEKPVRMRGPAPSWSVQFVSVWREGRRGGAALPLT